MTRLLLATALVIALLCGCAPAPALVRHDVALAPPPDGTPLYVIPFAAVMVPQELVDGIFDRLVDELNAAPLNGAPVIILKRDPNEIGPAWLADKYYLTGELFGYVRDSGCCSTELRLRTRVSYHQPQHEAPTLVITCPREELFDHDTSSFDIERQKLVDDVTRTLVAELRRGLAPQATP